MTGIVPYIHNGETTPKTDVPSIAGMFAFLELRAVILRVIPLDRYTETREPIISPAAQYGEISRTRDTTLEKIIRASY